MRRTSPLRNSCITDSHAAAKSAEVPLRLALRPAAYALLRNSRITDPPAAAKSSEVPLRLALRPAAYALLRNSRITDPPAAAKSSEVLLRLALRSAAYTLLLILSVSAVFGQRAAFVVGEKLAGSVGFYDHDGKRLSGVKLGSHPHEMVFSPDRKTLYVADNGVVWMTETGAGENTVSVVDIAARAKTGVIDLGQYHRPHGIAFDARSGRLFVTTENPSFLLALDPVARKIVRKYEVQGKAPHIVQLGADSAWAYVSNTDTGTLAAIDAGSGEVKLIAIGERPQGMAFSADLKTLYVANSGGTSIAIVDAVKNALAGRITTGKAPVRLTVSRDGKMLIYALQEGRAVGFADLAAGKEVATVPLPGRPVSLTLSLDGRLAYSSVQEEDKICVISVADRKIVRVFDVPKGTGPDPVFPLE